ncbi:pilus assembly protein PilV (plasmid) [Salmonella enterica subsp. enterica serovar Infantis]|nr:pilus assembly protein PilV [Escherichia coli]
MRGDGMLTSKEAKNNANNHSLQACQSGRWSGGNKINYSACNWYKSSVAMNHFIGGKSDGSIYYKPIQCPTGYIMTGTRMYGIGDGVDEEHVDAYCCPFN